MTAAGISAGQIPAKIEGITFGPDLREGSETILHTLWVANDNDFLATIPDASGNMIDNPNQFFVFGFREGVRRLNPHAAGRIQLEATPVAFQVPFR
jgi:hypothetical protein